MTKLRVWHIPQVPMASFLVEVTSVEEGVRLMDALADYDLFQYENNVKPDYCNANGLQMFREEDQEWVDWYNDEYDDPREYLDSLETEDD